MHKEWCAVVADHTHTKTVSQRAISPDSLKHAHAQENVHVFTMETGE